MYENIDQNGMLRLAVHIRVIESHMRSYIVYIRYTG